MLEPPGSRRPSRAVELAAAAGLVAAALLSAASILVATASAATTSATCGGGSTCVSVTAAPYGNGSGHVATTDASFATGDGAIDCSRSGGITFGTCSHTYGLKHGQTLTIHVRWSAAAGSETCVGPAPLGAQCGSSSSTASYTFTAGGDLQLDDRGFVLLDPATLTVNRSGSGSGTVTSDPVGIDCGSRCTTAFAAGSTVHLSADPTGSSTFDHWTGACAGTAPSCSVDVHRKTSVGAVFAIVVAATPSPTPAPTAPPSAGPSPRATAPSGGSGGGGASGPPGSPGPSDSGVPAASPVPDDSSAPADSPAASPAGPAGLSDPPATSTPAAAQAGLGSPDTTFVVAIAAVLTAIVVTVGIAALAITDRRARDRERREAGFRAP